MGRILINNEGIEVQAMNKAEMMTLFSQGFKMLLDGGEITKEELKAIVNIATLDDEKMEMLTQKTKELFENISEVFEKDTKEEVKEEKPAEDKDIEELTNDLKSTLKSLIEEIDNI